MPQAPEVFPILIRAEGKDLLAAVASLPRKPSQAVASSMAPRSQGSGPRRRSWLGRSITSGAGRLDEGLPMDDQR